MLPNSDLAKAEPFCADRIGFARLTAMAFNGIDLRPLRDELITKVVGGTAGPGEGLDLSLIAQLLGEKQTGLSIQAEVLGFHQLFRSPCSAEPPKLRVLALAAKVKFVIDPKNPYPANYTGHMRATLKDGSVIEERQPHLRGGAQEPLTRQDVAATLYNGRIDLSPLRG